MIMTFFFKISTFKHCILTLFVFLTKFFKTTYKSELKFVSMTQILEKIITDQNLAWDNTLQNEMEKFYVALSNATITELLENRMNLEENSKNFINLQKEIEEFRKILLNGCGFFIIKNSCFSDFSEDEQKSIFSIISKILGTLYVQNIKNEKFVVITDEGKSMKTGGRYHQTNQGGSYKTKLNIKYKKAQTRGDKTYHKRQKNG